MNPAPQAEDAAATRPRRDRYEAQLTPEELAGLHAALLDETGKLDAIRDEAPPWRRGPFTGSRPSATLLDGIRERLLLIEALDENEATSEILRAALNDDDGRLAGLRLDEIGHGLFTALAIRRLDVKTFLQLQAARLDAEKERAGMILREREAARADITVDLARQRFQRDTCETFLKWSEDRRAKEIAEAPSSNAEKIEMLGRIMFGEDWRDTGTDAG